MKKESVTHHHEGGKHTLRFTIDGNTHEWHEQYITGREIKKLGSIPEDCDLFLAIEKPWHDEHIKDDEKVDLAKPGIEHFYHKKKHEEVPIFIDDVRYEVHRGKHSVKDLKSLGKVPEAYELEQVVHGKLTPLKDDAIIEIKGCEVFFGHVRCGESS